MTSICNRAFLLLASQVETLVTIHVHQRDVMNDLATLHRHKRISDANDFEWLKQVQCRLVPVSLLEPIFPSPSSS